MFADGQRLIAGNKCEKPTLRAGAKQEALPDLYKVKNDLLRSYRGRYHHEKKIGIPLVLNMYDLLPFWVEFFHQVGYETLISPQTNKAMYRSAQHSIPSDTAGQGGAWSYPVAARPACREDLLSMHDLQCG